MRFYLISLDNVKPTINDLTAQKVLGGDLDFTNHLRVCVVLVSHVKNQRVCTMTNLKVLNNEIEELMISGYLWLGNCCPFDFKGQREK